MFYQASSLLFIFFPTPNVVFFFSTVHAAFHFPIVHAVFLFPTVSFQANLLCLPISAG